MFANSFLNNQRFNPFLKAQTNKLKRKNKDFIWIHNSIPKVSELKMWKRSILEESGFLINDSDCHFLFLLVSAAVFSYKPLYKRVGEDAVLPCSVERRSNRDVYWVISRLRRAASEQMSCTANVEQTAASRLSVNSSCSLLIRNVTEEDAGRYVCRDRQDYYNYIPVFLEVLTSEYSEFNHSEGEKLTPWRDAELIESFRLEEAQTDDRHV